MPVLEAVDNIGIVVSNVLKSQSKLEGLKAKLSDVGTPEGKELLVQSSDWQWLCMIYIYIIYDIYYIYIYIKVYGYAVVYTYTCIGMHFSLQDHVSHLNCSICFA